MVGHTHKNVIYHCIHLDKIIPLRVDEAMVEQIDMLVSDGTFRSRNDGIRAGIREIP